LGRYQLREYYAIEVKGEFEKGKALPEELEFAINELEKTIEKQPDSYYSKIVLAQLYNDLGKKEREKLARADMLLKQAIELSPRNLYAYWDIVETKLLQKEYKDALWWAEKAIEIEPRVKYSHILYLKVLKEMGEEDLLREKKRALKKIFPDISL
jgi:Tfp pilus assembly protein PilF